MMWKIGTLVASFIALWFLFFLLSNVDTRDVVAYNEIEDHVGSQPFRAGDLITVSRNGPGPRLICSPQITAEGLRETPLAKTYVNGLSQALSPFTRLAGWVAELAGRKAAAPEVGTEPVMVRFTGRISTFPAVDATPMMGRDCACAVAQALLRREQVCMVERSLIETRFPGTDAAPSERTVGITLRPNNVIFSETAIAALQCPGLETANTGLELQTGACVRGPGPGYDVALRHILGVIREENLTEDEI